MGAFGSNSHYVANSTGGELVEVNLSGKVIRTYTFPYGWGFYRVEPISLLTTNDFDNQTHTSDFTINLSTLNALAGVQDIYYKINNGTTESVSVNGQPLITTQGNNTLEYWSVDKTGIEESPHRLLTGIELSTSTMSLQTPLTNNAWTEFAVVLAIIAAVALVASYLRRVRRYQEKAS